MDKAKKRLVLESMDAANFEHKGIRGDERAAALAKFFHERLPETFGVQKGEAIDYRDVRTGQLDFVIYDRYRCAPIHTGNENLLLPCEALYCVVEVKTRVTQEELDTSYIAAGKVRSLMPFKKAFVAARQDGVDASDSRARCLYMLFGYTSDLSNDSDWPRKEYGRLLRASKSAQAHLDCVERLVVLDRGIINTQRRAGKWEEGSADSIFLESFLHVVNFLGRESERRRPVDWQIYGPRSTPGWRSL
jgi:hypothetical protein